MRDISPYPFVIAVLIGMILVWFNFFGKNKETTNIETSCKYIAFPAATSHIKFNPCTGEGWVIVRGEYGYEWQKIL